MANQADLAPYISAALARVPSSDVGAILDNLANEAAQIIPAIKSGPTRTIIERIESDTTSVGKGTLHTAGLIYTEARTPRWVPNAALQDIAHELLLVCRRSRAIAILTTDAGMGQRLVSLFGNAKSPSFGKLVKLPAAQLNSAFLVGETRTVWMSGLHRRTAYKPDSKVFAGTDVRAALEPLGDQTYRLTAARARVDGIKSPDRDSDEAVIGVNPLKSRIWVGQSKEWSDFASITWHILGAADNAGTLNDPLPVLASAASKGALPKVPYDVSVIDPILLPSDGAIDVDLVNEADRWANRASFEPTATTDPLNFTVKVTLDGTEIGLLKFAVEITNTGQATIKIDAPDDASDELLAARHAAQRPGWLTVRYESGHTLTHGEIYATRFQDRPFNNWMWEDFDVNGRKFDITKEKPTKGQGSTAFDPAAIDAPKGTSLFSWVLAHWKDRTRTAGRGWLACDDGKDEIADFIHLDESPPQPRLSLIHVKASGSSSTTREISTSEYEVVVGQAIKNLRFLDLANLADRLEQGNTRAAAPANWKDGVKDHPKRKNLVAYLRKIGTNLDIQVVILQPRVRKNELEGARRDAAKGTNSSRLRRARQLDALLLEAEAACRNVNAGFIVVGDAEGR